MFQTDASSDELLKLFRSTERSLYSTGVKIFDAQELYATISGAKRSPLRWVFFLISRAIYFVVTLITTFVVIISLLEWNFSKNIFYVVGLLFLFGPIRSRIIIPWLLGVVSGKINKLSVRYQELKASFDSLVEQYLLPDVRRMGMATAQDVQEKTIGSVLRIDTVQVILEEQVSYGKMEKVPLHSGEVLYKSSLTNSDENSVEIVTLSSDEDELVFVTYSSDSNAPPENNKPALIAPSCSELDASNEATKEIKSSVNIEATTSHEQQSKSRIFPVAVFTALVFAAAFGFGYREWTLQVEAEEQADLLAKAQIEQQLQKAGEEKRLKEQQEQAQKEAGEAAALKAAEESDNEKATEQVLSTWEQESEQFQQQSFAGTTTNNLISTRFGSLKIKENEIFYEGNPLNPSIQGNTSLSTLGVYSVSNADIVLVRDNGGTSCPSLYYLIYMSKNGVKATPSFGTCGDLIEIKQVNEKLLIVIPEFVGIFEPETKSTPLRNTIFTFDGTVLKENGNILK